MSYENDPEITASLPEGYLQVTDGCEVVLDAPTLESLRTIMIEGGVLYPSYDVNKPLQIRHTYRMTNSPVNHESIGLLYNDIYYQVTSTPSLHERGKPSFQRFAHISPYDSFIKYGGIFSDVVSHNHTFALRCPLGSIYFILPGFADEVGRITDIYEYSAQSRRLINALGSFIRDHNLTLTLRPQLLSEDTIVNLLLTILTDIS